MPKIRGMLGWVVAALLSCVCASACGRQVKTTSASDRSRSASVVSEIAGNGVSAAPSPSLHLRNDEDDDDDVANNHPRHGQTHRSDRDEDSDNDDIENGHKGYFDKDDGAAREFGRPAGPADWKAITKLLKRYYASAARAEGATACSLTLSGLAQAVPQEYGRAPGVKYHSATTCAAVLSRLFQYLHGELAAPVHFTDVRVQGEEARVLLGSKTRPASYVTLQRERGAWRVAGVLGRQLP